MKFYTVWVGAQPGVYNSWTQAEAQVKNFKGSRYKSFKTEAEAEEAYSRPWQEYYPDMTAKRKVNQEQERVLAPEQAHDYANVHAPERELVPAQLQLTIAEDENGGVDLTYGLAPGETPW